jgi:hypothetical protein
MLKRSAAEVEVANGALVHLREAPLNSLDDDRTAAVHVRAHFGSVRDALLRRHPWNFAETRDTLAQDPLASKGKFDLTFPLPGDCVRVFEVENADANTWQVETRKAATEGVDLEVAVLSTSISAPRVVYNRIVGNPALWDPLFVEVFSLKLAAKIGGGLGRDKTELDSLSMEAEKLLMVSRRADEREAARQELPRDIPHLTRRV